MKVRETNLLNFGVGGYLMDKNWMKISFIYVGTVIGAGFASGGNNRDF